MHEAQRPAIGKQLGGQQRISRSASRPDVQAGQRRDQTQFAALAQHRQSSNELRRSLVQPAQPGQHRPFHLSRDTLGDICRLRRTGLDTVRGEIKD